MRFEFELQLSGDTVKKVVFPNGRGRRELLTSGGQSIGHVALTDKGLRVNIIEGAAHMLAEAEFV